MPKIDPDLQAVVDLLPADGAEKPYAEWREDVIKAGYSQQMNLIQSARMSGLVLFSFNAAGVHVVRRAK